MGINFNRNSNNNSINKTTKLVKVSKRRNVKVLSDANKQFLKSLGFRVRNNV